MIIADDLNTMSPTFGYAHAQTPNIDRLARQGTTFYRAFCNQAWCGPSRTSFLTGLYPWHTGIGSSEGMPNPRTVLPNRPWLPKVFKDAGYITVGIGKVEHWPMPELWHEQVLTIEALTPWSYTGGYYAPGAPPRPASALRTQIPSPQVRGHSGDGQIQGWDSPDTDFLDGWATTVALNRLDTLKASGNPFFLAVGYYMPHAPYIVPQQYLDRYDPAQIPLAPEPPRNLQGLSWWQNPATTFIDRPPATPEERRRMIWAYLASVSYLDAQLGRLLDKMDQLNLWNDTIVVLLSDHGQMLGEHETAWSKFALFEESIRVPLIIAAPGTNGVGTVTRRTVSLVDLFPTLCDLAGVPLPAVTMDGRSLRPLLQNPNTPWPYPAFGMRDWSRYWTRAAGRVITTEDWRLSQWVDGHRALYDMRNDLQEVTNRAPNRPDIVTSLAALFPPSMTMGRTHFYLSHQAPEYYRRGDRDVDGAADYAELELPSLGFSPTISESNQVAEIIAQRAAFGLMSTQDVLDVSAEMNGILMGPAAGSNLVVNLRFQEAAILDTNWVAAQVLAVRTSNENVSVTLGIPTNDTLSIRFLAP